MGSSQWIYSLKISEGRTASFFIVENQAKQESRLFVAGFLLYLTFDPGDGCSTFPETSVDFYSSALRWIPEDSNFHTLRCEKSESIIISDLILSCVE